MKSALAFTPARTCNGSLDILGVDFHWSVVPSVSQTCFFSCFASPFFSLLFGFNDISMGVGARALSRYARCGYTYIAIVLFAEIVL